MEVLKMRTFVMYLMLSRLYIDMIKTENAVDFDAMPRLKELCPFSYFCGLNASEEFVSDENKIPCCQSCSCRDDCGYHGNCCYNRLDEYNTMREESMVCRNTYEIDREANKDYSSLISEPVPHYWIVNKCRFISSDVRFPSETLDYKNMTFAPVFSSSAGVSYYNAFISKCNNVSDAIPWRRILSCSNIAVASLPDIIDKGKGKSTFQECISYFTPPETEDRFKQCYSNTIRQCNVTGTMSKRDEFWPLCGMFNSTFILTTPRYVKSYANVYCYICNTDSEWVWGNIKRATKCNRLNEMSHKIPLIADTALTIILKFEQTAKETINSQTEDQCGRNRRMVKSFTSTCRSIRCPTGQILFNRTCDFYSEKWIGGPFVAMLRLSPIYDNAYLQTSILEDFITNNYDNERASWIRRNTLKRWSIIVFYHPSKSFSHVEFITVKAIYPFQSVNPKILMGLVMKALQDVWRIQHLKKTYSFRVSLNDFVTYDRLNQPVKVSRYITRDTYYPHKKHACEHVKMSDFEYKHTLYSVAKIDGPDLNRGLLLTKMFFCNQIELFPEEFEFSSPTCSQNILFKVKNVTIHTFTALTAMDVNPELTHKSLNRIFVCLHEFRETVNDNVSMFIKLYHFIFIICLKFII